MTGSRLPSNAKLGKVAVLMGGRSAEREVSLMSGQGVLKALLDSGVDAHAFDPAQRDLMALKQEGFDRCFIALHGRFGEDGTVQGALELMGIPYTGSGVMASSMAMDKVMTKRVWQAEGLPTPRHVLVHPAQIDKLSADELIAVLGLPLIVKPAREGSSIGVSKVTQAADLPAALRVAAACDSDILCEQCIVGDEVTCPVLGDGSDAQALPMIRIVAPDGNYDYQNKYFTDDTQYLVPCGLPESEMAAIDALVIKAYQVMGCRGWGRIDVMIDAATRQPYLLEINTSPGMTGHSLVPMSARAAGMSYEALCCHLVAHASLDYKGVAQ
ncbi:D-alanine--D-alanine ligase [Limnohabitans sp. Rim28]|uniref:D-alanine--D-alanine ligase n=1 Tax=Limnohabitans sp. Rim28 TaxID=1100720 RepID=UPI0002D7A69B|nr:D-alanine--D-alanine ligase [Limnohabitans sp. Rim28]PVE07729.1 D-alanine--D-alanine ligase [Limnohabitans sp. Rim28]